MMAVQEEFILNVGATRNNDNLQGSCSRCGKLPIYAGGYGMWAGIKPRFFIASDIMPHTRRCHGEGGKEQKQFTVRRHLGTVRRPRSDDRCEKDRAAHKGAPDYRADIALLSPYLCLCENTLGVSQRISESERGA